MAYIIFELCAVVWLAGSNNIHIGMVWVVVGILFAKQATPKQ